MQKYDPLFQVKVKEDFVKEQLQTRKSRGIAVSENRIAITCEETYSNNAHFHLVRVYNRQNLQNEFNIDGFNIPQGVAMDEDECIYIADSDNNQIVKFYRNGKYQKRIKVGDETSLELKKPQGLHIFGRLLYVCSQKNHSILILDLNLTLCYKLDESQFLLNPRGIVYNPGEECFYAVTETQAITRIQISSDKKTFCVSKILSSDQLAHFENIRRIAVCSGHILVAQNYKNLITCLTVEGELKGEQKMKRPTDLAVYKDTVYVCSGSVKDMIQKLKVSNDGTILLMRESKLQY